jgi:RNA polymerase sigma factor (sigma-70 family)
VPTSADVLLRHIRKLAAEPDPTVPDGELLRRFAVQHDQTAFHTLVRRHGSMVLSVGRRVLGNLHDAEDVFQATFLVLARKAASTRWQPSIGPWLYQVAYRLARQTRSAAVRRRVREGQVPAPAATQPLADLTLREAQQVVDEEMIRLPEKLRAPLLLCYLQGRTRDEAAQHLGWSLGTLKRRLEQARETLRLRLTKRGLTLSSILLAGMLQELAVPAPLSAALVETTIRAAELLIRGKVITGLVSMPVVSLIRGANFALILARLKVVAALFLLLGMLTLGVGLVAYPLPQDSPPGGKGHPPPNKEEPRATLTDILGDPLPEGALARMGTLRFRCQFQVYQLTFSPNGKLLAAAGTDGLRIWEFPSGKERFHLVPDGGLRAVNAVEFSPDGKLMAVGGADFSVRLWDAASGKELRKLGQHNNRVVTLDFAPDGKTLAAGSAYGSVRLWETATGKALAEFKEPLGMRGGDLAFCDKGRTLAIHTTKDLVLREVPSGKVRKRYPIGEGRLVYSADRKYAAWGYHRYGLEDPLRLYDLKTGKLLPPLIGHTGLIIALAFSPDGKTLVSAGSDNTIRLWDIDTRKELRRLSDQRDWTHWPMSFSPDGKYVVAGSMEGNVRVWEVATGKQLQPGERHKPYPMALAFSPDGATLVSVDDDTTVRFWDSKGKVLKQVREGEPGQPIAPRSQNVVSFSRDGKILGLGHRRRKELSFLDIVTGKESFELEGRTFLFSPDGKTLALVEAPLEKLWLCEADNGKLIRELKGPVRHFAAMTFSPDGKTLTAGVVNQRDYSVWSWDVASGKGHALLKELPPQGAPLAFSSNGRTMAAGGMHGNIHFWDLHLGRDRHKVPGQWGIFSPDGRTFVVGTSEAVRLYEVATGQERRRFVGHNRNISSFVFSSDGRKLASGSQDTTVLVWDVTGRLQDGKLPAAALTQAQLDQAWDDLGQDGTKAHRAIWTLIAAPKQVVPFLKKQLRPVEFDAKKLAQWIAELNHEKFQVRAKAQAEIEKLEILAEKALRHALAQKPALEFRQRLEKLITRLETQSPAKSWLRTLRSLEVLEQIGSAEARQVLETMAKGAPEAELTQDAKAALVRLHTSAPPGK